MTLWEMFVDLVAEMWLRRGGRKSVFSVAERNAQSRSDGEKSFEQAAFQFVVDADQFGEI